MTDAVDWDRVQPMSMPGFLERFTLHDSGFKRLSIDSGRVSVEISFDLVWNRSVPEGYDTLAFRFDRPYKVHWVQGPWEQNTISGAESAVLEPATRADLLNQADSDLAAYQGPRDEIPHPASDETVTRTRLLFVNWATLEVLHGGAVRFVAIDSEGRTIDASTIPSAAT